MWISPFAAMASSVKITQRNERRGADFEERLAVEYM